MKCCMFEKIEDPKKKALSDRINGIGGALFLLMIGGLLLISESNIPDSTWLIGAGLILLGINGARRLNNIRLCGCGIVLGIVLLVAGICGLYGIEVPVFPVLLILVGIHIIAGLITKKKQ